MTPLAVIPDIYAEIGGTPLSNAERRALSEVIVRQRLSAPSVCELTFTDVDESARAANAFLPGLSFQLSIGPDRALLMRGEVTAVEYEYEPGRGRVVRVRAYDVLHRLRKRQPVRAHIQVSLADLARELTADLGVSIDARQGGPMWRRLIQYRQSDLDFLASVAEWCGQYLALHGDTLALIDLRGAGAPIRLRTGYELLKARIAVNGDTACGKVVTMGWDPAHITWHSGSSEQSNVGREVAARVKPEDVGGDGGRTFTNRTSTDPAYAAAVAQAELDARAVREVSLWGLAVGDPALRTGAVVEVGNVPEAVKGKYVLCAVTHTVDRERGYLTEISTEPPEPRPLPSGFFAAPGKVTRIDDPEKLGRVQVQLPTIGDLETDWMCVMSAGAGAGKGLITLADVGDQVIVLCAVENPATGFVLGSLYGSEGFPDTGIESGVVARYTLLTPGGQRLKLDDSRKSMRIENSAGSFIEFVPDGVTVHAAADLMIEAPGRTIRIQANHIDFKRA